MDLLGTLLCLAGRHEVVLRKRTDLPCASGESCARGCGWEGKTLPSHEWNEWKSVDRTHHERSCKVCPQKETGKHGWFAARSPDGHDGWEHTSYSIKDIAAGGSVPAVGNDEHARHCAGCDCWQVEEHNTAVVDCPSCDGYGGKTIYGGNGETEHASYCPCTWCDDTGKVVACVCCAWEPSRDGNRTDTVKSAAPVAMTAR